MLSMYLVMELRGADEHSDSIDQGTRMSGQVERRKI